MGQATKNRHHRVMFNAMEWQMPPQNDLSRSLISFEQAVTLVAVIELSHSSWLIAGTIPGIERQPLKKIAPDQAELLRVLHRWREEAVRKGHTITRITVAFEAGRDGFWLARWLTGHGIEAHIIHSSSVAVSREHRRAKTDRLDTAMLMRVFLGWLRGEHGHCSMVAIPTMEEEDAKRPCRERENLVGERTRIINRLKSTLVRLGIRGFKPQLRKAPQLLESLRTPEDSPIPPNTLDEMQRDLARLALLREQIEAIEQARLARLEKAPTTGPHAMIRMLASIRGVGIETADMLVREVLSRNLRDRRAVGRYAGLTGAPDESGAKRREKGLAKSGNARVRRGLIQLAWRFLLFQKDSALAQWFRNRTEGVQGARKTKVIVALARKLLIALWRMVTTGEAPHGVVLRQAA
jgi:transposase